MPIYYEAKTLDRTIDAAPRITPSTKSVLKKIIRSAPVAEVVKVTRCKDCKHYRIFLKRDMCAKNAQVLDGHEVGLTATNPDNFCSYGERKSG